MAEISVSLLAVDLDADTRLADRVADGVPLLLQVEQLDVAPLVPSAELDELRFAAIEIDGAEERLVCGVVLLGRLGDREGGEQCEYESHRASRRRAGSGRCRSCRGETRRGSPRRSV